MLPPQTARRVGEGGHIPSQNSISGEGGNNEFQCIVSAAHSIQQITVS